MISGQSIITQRLTEGMAARGHSVLVIAASERGTPYVEDQANLRIVRLRSLNNPFRVGQRIMSRSWREVYKELLRFNPDLIHAHDPLHSALMGIYAIRGWQVKTAFTAHQLPWFVSDFVPFHRLRRTVDKALWVYARWLCAQYDTVIAPSRTIARMIEARTGIMPRTISNGMDLETFQPQPVAPNEREILCRRFGLNPEHPVILHVGQLNVQKQVDFVIRAAAQVMQQFEAQLLVIGDGKQRKALIRLAKKLGILDQSFFPGYVSIADGLPAVYRLGSVFVTASEVETQGLALLEAMASGLPIVAVDSTCIPELVWDGFNGYLAKPKDVVALSRLIIGLLNDPHKAGQMGQEARKIASEHSFSVTLESHETIYAHLLSDRSTASRLDALPQELNNPIKK
jgi:glycosyltransferase involved in cell wall biosynthesis